MRDEMCVMRDAAKEIRQPLRLYARSRTSPSASQLWTVDCGLWTVDGGLWTVDLSEVCLQKKAKNKKLNVSTVLSPKLHEKIIFQRQTPTLAINNFGIAWFFSTFSSQIDRS